MYALVAWTKVPVHMKMSYRDAFPISYSAGAYERMLLNAAKGEP